MPTTLNVIQPNLKYSLTVGLSSRVPFGRVVLVMDKKFCTDAAGNNFARTENSSFFVHFGESETSSYFIINSSVSSSN